MKVNYIYSACIVVETADARICCDPWFTDGIYEGSWYQYPKIKDPLAAIGKVSHVYISHIHRDHYDPDFLGKLMTANPDCQIIIGAENQEFLAKKMHKEGFAPLQVSRYVVGKTELAIIPNYADPEINIDTALVIKGDDQICLNMNDCAFDAGQVKEILDFCGRAPDLACLPYAGAGPYPQVYRFHSEEQQLSAIEGKKERFLKLFESYIDVFNPRIAVPFAGSYYLGGPFRKLNNLRGVPDAVEVLQRFGDRVVVLHEGEGCVNLINDEITGARRQMYDPSEVDRVLSSFDDEPLPYHFSEPPDADHLVKLLSKAHRNATTRIRENPSMSLCIKCPDMPFMWVNSAEPGVVRQVESAKGIGPREEIYIDSRLLSGLLTRRYHWQSAESGSHFEIYREPNIYDRRVYNLLYFLYI